MQSQSKVPIVGSVEKTWKPRQKRRGRGFHVWLEDDISLVEPCAYPTLLN